MQRGEEWVDQSERAPYRQCIMARISGAEPAGAGLLVGNFLRIVYWLTRRKVGKVVMPIRVTGNHPKVLFGVGMMEQALLSSRRVEPALKNLVSVRAATLVGCPF
jgi:hypothetical protein